MNNKTQNHELNNTSYLPVKRSYCLLNEKIPNKPVIFDQEKNKIKTSFNEPVIFNKKASPIKTIRFINNDTGKMMHFTPAAQEWFNSIYSYNENYTKLLPTADKNLMYLLSSYFNLFINPKKLNTKRIANRYRKLSANKIFVGKGELKHTIDKVIITSYIYNVEQSYLKSKIIKEARFLYYPKEELKRYVNKNTTGKINITYNRPFTLEEYLNLPQHLIWHKNTVFKLFWKKYVELIGQKILRNEEKTLKKLKGENNKNYIRLVDKTKTLFFELFSYNSNIKTSFNHSFGPLLQLVENKEKKAEEVLKFENEISKLKTFYDNFDIYISIAKHFYIKTFKRLLYLLMINNVKFEKPFIEKLTHLVKNIYNKEVKFNIVNLHKMHLNSDIYTQAVALKLKNRDNKLFRVLTRSLTKVKLPNISRLSEKYHKDNKDEYLTNKIRNVYINSMFNDSGVDHLNNLLVNFFPLAKNLEIGVRNRSSVIKHPVSLYKYVVRTLKHVKLAGIRVEAKGRLTRRFTAAKSVFKVKWKGGLKNVDSSFKGLPALMLRGDRKSNVEYSINSSKNRNGAFGVKGWIGSK